MKKKLLILAMAASMMFGLIGCSEAKEAETTVDEQVTEETTEKTSDESVNEVAEEPSDNTKEAVALELEDGSYTVDFTTDSGMFHVNETMEGKGTLTVADGVGAVHITLVSKNIVNLYLGMAADAEADTANQLQPTTDTVEYEDGTSEEVYGFDVPVPVIDEEFDLALLGTKGTWYDHKVMVSNPVKVEE